MIIYVYIYIYVCVYCVHQQYMRGEIEIYTYIIWVCVVKIGSFPCPLVCRFIYIYIRVEINLLSCEMGYKILIG